MLHYMLGHHFTLKLGDLAALLLDQSDKLSLIVFLVLLLQWITLRMMLWMVPGVSVLLVVLVGTDPTLLSLTAPGLLTR